MKEQFIDIYKAHIQREGADAFLEWLEKTDFFKAPASTRFHLAREGGLVEHSIHVYERLRELYVNEKQRNGLTPALTEQEEETIAICGLLHDICKVNFYTVEMRTRASGRSTRSMSLTISSPTATERKASTSSAVSCA